jgi:hypothetical protein
MMLRAALAILGKAMPWLLAKVSATTQASPPTTNLVSAHSYISGGDLMEKVNGVWQNSGISFAHAAVSADGLTVVAITGPSQVYVRKRASLAVSFNSSSPVYLSMPASSTDGSLTANLSRITVSDDGTKVVATAMKAVPGMQYVCSAIWNGSSWVLSTFSTSNPDNYGQDLYVSLSPGGTRLIQVRSDGRCFSFKYSGFPTIPWEDVGNTGFLPLGTITGAWRSESSWVAMSGTTMRVFDRPVASSALELSATFTKTDLGLPSASVLQLLGYVDGKYIMAVSLYTLAEVTDVVSSVWRPDVVASGNVPILAASREGRAVLLYNGTAGTNYPNSTLLLER